MKNIRKSFIFGLVVTVLMSLTSCNKWIDENMNTDPNKPADVSLNLILPSVEAGIGYQMGGDVALAVNMWMQQLSGLGNQPIAYDRYNLTQGDTDNMWKWGLYAGVMKDMNTMMTKAVSDESPWYGGIAKVLMAYTLGITTDLWGDVPYSDAFQGNNNLKAAYDSQEQIYQTLNTLLDEAINDLNAENSNFVPGGDDLIYGGDLELWLKAAYTLKARFALHLCKINSNSYNLALEAISHGFTDNSEDLEMFYGTPANEENPFYQFLVQRPGDVTMCANFVTMLIDDTDPRLPEFADTTGGAIGAHPGLGDGDCPPTGYYCNNVSPVPYISYVEALFIQAECEYKTGTGDPKATVKSAVAASLTKFGVYDDTWISGFNAKIDGLSGEDLFAEIMRQKYIALYKQIEPFNDWRRTGYPELEPAAYASTVDGQLPRRYPYPTSERIYNGNNMPPGLTVSSRVWWDVN